MPTINTYSRALDLLFQTSLLRDQGTIKLLEVNVDGSIRSQNLWEKLGNLGARIMRRYDARRDSKDAAVAIALDQMLQRARQGEDGPLDKALAQRHDSYGYLRRFHEARQRVELRNAPRVADIVPASAQQVRRDSVTSLHTQGVANYGATAQQLASVSIASATPSVRDTQEFKDRVAALEQEFGAADTRLYRNLIETRMTEPEGPIAQSLSDAQYYAIKSYSSASYIEMNAALRDPAGPESQDPQIVRLNEYAASGLKKLAQEGLSFKGITSRGIVNYDYFINLLPNQTYTASAFTSTTKNSAIARELSMADGAAGLDSTIIHTYGNTGIDIATLSGHQYESEILYPPGSEFRVVFTGEHTAELPSHIPNEPPSQKKVSYLVVEEVGISPQTGVSGIVDALDLAVSSSISHDAPATLKPSSQAEVVGPLVGNQSIEDSSSEAIHLEDIGKR